MTWLTKIALKKRWLTLLIAAVLTGVSVWSLFDLHMELIPDINIPVTSVIAVYPQAKPETVMNDVTVKVESALSDVEGLTVMNSTVSEGSSFTYAMFDYGIDMEKANQQIAENLAALDLPAAVRDLPKSMPQLGENPQLYPIDINMLPVVILSVSGDISAEELEQIAADEIIPAVSGLEGVYSASAEGISRQQVQVDIDPALLNGTGLPFSAVVGMLSGQAFTSLEEVEAAPLGMTGMSLGDISTVMVAYPSGSSISRVNGLPAVTINIMKESDANTVLTANAVTDAIADIGSRLPDGVTIDIVLDQSDYIENTIGDLTRDAVIGCVLAVVIVFLFLMAFKVSLVTAVSIPLSILFGFLIIRFFGVTINLVTLSAMAIAVGRVIDNSIVVLEVIYRRIQQGEPYRTAAIEGVREVAVPITSSTLATIVIFVPLALVGGIIGELFVPFALTMTAALVSSLLVALIVIPPMSDFKVRRNASGEWKQTWYERAYLKSLKWSLGHRLITVGTTVVLFFGSFALLPIIGTSFLPEMGEKMLNVDVTAVEETDLDKMLETAERIEQVLLDHPSVETVQTTVGASGGMMGGLGMSSGSASTAGLMAVLSGSADLDAAADELRELLTDVVPSGYGVKVTTGQAGASAMMGSGVDCSIRGDRYEDISAAALELYQEISDVDGITNIELTLADTEPKLDIIPDPLRAMSSGLSMEQLQGLQQEFFLMQMGMNIGQASVDGHTFDVHLSGIIPRLDNVEAAKALKVGFPVSVKLGDIAAVSLSEQQTSISRVDGKLSAKVTATITATDIGTVNRAVQTIIDGLDVADGVEITQGGTTQMMDDAFSDMIIAILIAIGLTYLIIAITFRSLLTPIIIMISLPLASIGAFIALLITGQTVGVLAMMGVLMLVGIVLTNAIVLVDLVERLRREKGMMISEAVYEAGKSRMRPILMTALTTMIAMLPLALGLGEGSIFSSELAIVVIGGLFSSTLLTLLVIPVIYSMFKREKQPKE
ncbi:MAG: efflux RND transporter permease subunit [Dehalococcoidales bacterium]|nr:efflux RND transporter permease subunit [Dehalococcoidales bacterium]